MCKSYKKPLLCLAIIFPLLSPASCRDTLTPTQPLSDGQILLSSDKVFTLGFFTPNNSNNNNRYVGIWYTNISPMNVFWVANRRRAVSGTSGILSVTASGNLTITDGASSSAVIWSSDSLQEEVGNPVAQLLDSGNFVVAKGNDLSYVAWQSFDYPTDTMIPGMSFIWNLTTGFTRNITAWASPTDPSPGNYTSALDLAGDPQLRLWVGSTRSLRSGPWDGVDFAELSPFNKTYIQIFSCDFVDNKEEVSYTCNAGNTTSTTTLLKLNYEGVLQRILGVEDGEWSVYWQNPSTRCDVLDVCGPYGVCQADELPICSCMPGFVPKSQANWNVGIWSDGCIRKTALDCHSGTTDGFVTMHQMFIPDTVNVTVDRQMSLDECKAKCLRNCSCKAVASANVRGAGTGCITWSMNLLDTQMFPQGGQDLYIRLAAADIESISIQTGKGRKATLAVVLSAVMGSTLLAISVCFLWRKRKQNTGLTSKKVDSHREEVSDLPLFDLETIVAATRNFSDENKLGEGGFGPVYKGLLTEGQEIAVKRLSKTSVQGFDELKTEVVLVAKLQHRNLVRLLGCCIQGAEMMLIYEYMANKGLDSFLFDKENGPILNWQTRYKIIHGIARGLLYLHQDSRFRIIHRDLKASNVLLDKDMNPKISDFGLARIFGGDETNAKTRRVVGTYGYMSPEYALNGIFSVKSDVFSFGVLVLEIISGRRNKGVYLSDSQEYLLGAAWTFWRDGNGLQLLDPSMDCSFPINEVLRCMKVGLLCVQERPEDRPSMSSVVLMLGSHYAPLPEPKQPGFVAGMSSSVEASSAKEHSHSINDVTITMSIAR